MVRLSTARKEGADNCLLGLVWGGGSPYCCMSILCSRIIMATLRVPDIYIYIYIYIYTYVYISISI